MVGFLVVRSDQEKVKNLCDLCAVKGFSPLLTPYCLLLTDLTTNHGSLLLTPYRASVTLSSAVLISDLRPLDY